MKHLSSYGWEVLNFTLWYLGSNPRPCICKISSTTQLPPQPRMPLSFAQLVTWQRLFTWEAAESNSMAECCSNFSYQHPLGGWGRAPVSALYGHCRGIRWEWKRGWMCDDVVFSFFARCPLRTEVPCGPWLRSTGATASWTSTRSAHIWLFQSQRG